MFFETKKMINIGLLDENFFIYYSDYDLCRKIYAIKESVIQVKNSSCIHVHGISKVHNKYKRIFLRENNLLFDELYYYYKINSHIIKIKKFNKKFLKYFVKASFFLLILRLDKFIFFIAKIFAYFRFLFFLNRSKF